MAVEIKRDCMRKPLDGRARISTNKMNLQRNELLYLCLEFNWAPPGIISAEFARVVVLVPVADPGMGRGFGVLIQSNPQVNPFFLAARKKIWTLQVIYEKSSSRPKVPISLIFF